MWAAARSRATLALGGFHREEVQVIVVSNVLSGIAYVLSAVLSLMTFIVIGRAIISWVNPDPHNPIVRFLNDSTEPLLTPLRRYIKPIGGTIDLTPIVLLLIIYFLQHTLVGILGDYATLLRAPR
jgi:YggT family protein